MYIKRRVRSTNYHAQLGGARAEGAPVLVSYVGPVHARGIWFMNKIAKQRELLARIRGPDRQARHLLLRFCTRQKLRHFQRSLRNDDLTSELVNMDKVLQSASPVGGDGGT